MFKNYLKIAFRSLFKNKVYSGINIMGLTIGLTCCILIALYIRDEASYDSFHSNGDDLYRMVLERIYPDHVSEYAIIPAGFSEVLASEITEIERTTRLVGFSNFSSTVEFEDLVFEESYTFFADSNFFSVFDFELIQGDPSTALKNPNTVIVTQSTARKYFGDENPVGQTIKINDTDTEVVGLMQDIPTNSHIKLDFLSSTTNLPFLVQPNYLSFSSYTYLELAKGADPAQVEAKIPAVVEKYASGQIERRLGLSYQEYVNAGNGYNYSLQPIADIHLVSNMENEIKPNGNITYIYIFISIAIFVLLIACINFVNLATARSAERAQEVGIRKVMGSERGQLIRQFLTEAVFLTFLGLVISLAVIQAVLPLFNSFAQKQLSLPFTTEVFFIPILLLLIVAIGFFAGSYPAFYITALQPIETIKGKFRSSKKGMILRNGMVVFQFAISIILITGTLVVREQMDYIQNKGLGFDKENVLIIEGIGGNDDSEILKQELERMTEVRSVGFSSSLPGGFFFGTQFRKEGVADIATTKAMTVDDNFLASMGMEVTSGRGFSEEYDDTLSVILNESAASALGFENPVGERIINAITVNGEETTIVYNVIGVIGDFNFESLHTEVTPLAVFSTEGSFGPPAFAATRVFSDNINRTVGTIEQKWKNLFPGQPFEYSFLDDDLNALYESEQKSSYIFTIFAVLAIAIACIGLFGLAAYSAFQRTKEIGVRKVLGSSVSSIVLLLSKDFTRLVAIAFVFSAPLSYFIMSRWLQNFAYRVEVDIVTVIIAGLITLGIALLTVSYQSIKAAIVNPVESLKSE